MGRRQKNPKPQQPEVKIFRKSVALVLGVLILWLFALYWASERAETVPAGGGSTNYTIKEAAATGSGAYEDHDKVNLLEAIDILTASAASNDARGMKKLQAAGIYSCYGSLIIIKTRKKNSIVRLTTGSQALDELLGGGIQTMAITEGVGDFRYGISELAYTLCVSAQLPKTGNAKKVAYIATTDQGAFRPDRVIPIAERFGMDPAAALNNVKLIFLSYILVRTHEDQYDLVLGLTAKMAEEPSTFRLVIVDSIISHLQVDFTGRSEFVDHQQRLAQLHARLMSMIEEFNVAIYYLSNHVITDPMNPAEGQFLASPIRLSFSQGKGDHHFCKVYDTLKLHVPEAILQVTPGGIV
ncbi:hypothetical protein BUALT_Bualt06G0129400 [Buddleja alternifolia]|uniref:RecA family profile 1 domain-containing protein n=1 Tax=Buddleja alternifolia TaxID=168488 RepID=A0AAV6XLS3_9LAMI|nr:hypothetical protein BUALT_Bualt06G0129400 [Buddleja alternifolia]